jgi:hypothetical protein
MRAITRNAVAIRKKRCEVEAARIERLFSFQDIRILMV